MLPRFIANEPLEAMTTPPPPSSSPGIIYDSMDISPLPHKHPYVDETQIEPTPLEIPAEDMTRVAEEASEMLFEPSRYVSGQSLMLLLPSQGGLLTGAPQTS